MRGRELPKDWDANLPSFPADPKGMATRTSSGKVLNEVAKVITSPVSNGYYPVYVDNDGLRVVSTGEIVVPAGVRLTPARLAAAAASGVAELSCVRRPRVTVLATGSELVDPGGSLRPGQIYETNSLMLSAALTATGAEVVAERPVADDEEALRETLERGLAADVLVTSGGVSVGEHDLVDRRRDHGRVRLPRVPKLGELGSHPFLLRRTDEINEPRNKVRLLGVQALEIDFGNGTICCGSRPRHLDAQTVAPCDNGSWSSQDSVDR
jgi:hypothetical protein